jgi:multiple sugar transport system permease protein/sn-glycerol 3-phosphate transport system permease protein
MIDDVSAVASRTASVSPPAWYHSRRVRAVIWKAVVYLIVATGAVVVAFPFFWQVTTSLKSPTQLCAGPPEWIPWPLHPENYAEVASVVPLWLYVKNSLIIAVCVIVGTEISCAMAAYAFARLRFPGRNVIFLVLISALIIPGTATTVPQFVFFQRIGWYNTFYPLIVPAFFGNAFFIFLLRQFFLSIPPELEAAARVDGCGFFSSFWRIILPLSKPALATVAIFSFVWTWNDFFTPLVYLSDQQKYTLPLGLVFFEGSPHSTVQTQLLLAMSFILTAPCIVAYFVAQRAFIQGIVITGVKG